MSKVTIATTSVSEWGEYESVEIRVDGVAVSSGSYGGEPEDNSRHRDYDWVEHAIASVAKALGASVEYTDYRVLSKGAE